MGHLNERGWINVATLAVYVPLLAGTLFTLIRQRFRMKSFYYLLTFILVKFVGAAMTIDVQLNNNTTLYTPAAILSTVVLTPLIMAVAELINLKHAAPTPNRTRNRSTTRGLRPLELVNRSANTPSTVPPAYTPSPSPYPPSPSPTLNKPLPPAPRPPPRTARLTRLAHLSILLSLALGVTGGLRVFATAPSASDLSSGRTYMRGAAALAALALVLVAANAVAGFGTSS
ncbi:hypothetical protein UCDDS831_g08850 [Diplodia seriata]|uniref:DUF7702 domain-containing protein n=1 Tax=Diplodia seriata TaxID=420778 RepID=A0A0G2FNW4_9PEZI|nr:hypothetical protein UCDDS831_g08850 [Diplodia seriata]